MAIDVTGSARTLFNDALAQNDVDMNFHKLLNLDTSNLTTLGAPPTINPPANQWLRAWDNPSHTWTATQPAFTNISGTLTLGFGGQQRAIIELGTIGVGTWRATALLPDKVPVLNQINAPVADVQMANHKIINLGDPTAPGDAVNLRFVDSMLQGLNPKQQVRLANTATFNRNGIQTVDGKTTHTGDRILFKGSISEAHLCGIYIANDAGPWARSTDCSNYDPAHPETDINRAYCAVLEGNINAGSAWVEVNPVLGPGIDNPTQPKNFVLFSSATALGPPGPPGPGVPEGGSTDQVLAKVDDTDYNTKWVDPGGGGFGTPPPVYAALQTGAGGPLAAIAHVVGDLGRMEGQAYYITPQTTGKVVVTIAGFMWNDNAAGQVSLRMCVGSGTAPAHGVAQPVGTSVLVGAVAAASEGGATKAVPFSVTSVVTTLTAGIQFWYDLLVTANTTGNAILAGVSCSAFEIP